MINKAIRVSDSNLTAEGEIFILELACLHSPCKLQPPFRYSRHGLRYNGGLICHDRAKWKSCICTFNCGLNLPNEGAHFQKNRHHVFKYAIVDIDIIIIIIGTITTNHQPQVPGPPFILPSNSSVTHPP